MNKITTNTEIFHSVPKNLQILLDSNTEILEKWNSLTPLAQNEWICWITIAKKQETRDTRLRRLGEDLLKEKRRPCCWAGCPHRNPNAKKWH
jgi:uncharacterized protein YdeI (YjbR/CyaY-like superfamily)